MPTYGYRCTKCERLFDSFHSMSCTDPQHCPDCGAVGKKLMSASSVIFKGSGFYSTDYRDSGYLEAKKQDVKPTDKSTENSDKKSEKTISKESTEKAPAKKVETTAPKAA